MPAFGKIHADRHGCNVQDLLPRIDIRNEPVKYFTHPPPGAHNRADSTALMTRTETQELFDRRVDAWRRHDVDALLLAHTQDCVLESPIAGKVTGRSCRDRERLSRVPRQLSRFIGGPARARR